MVHLLGGPALLIDDWEAQMITSLSSQPHTQLHTLTYWLTSTHRLQLVCPGSVVTVGAPAAPLMTSIPSRHWEKSTDGEPRPSPPTCLRRKPQRNLQLSGLGWSRVRRVRLKDVQLRRKNKVWIPEECLNEIWHSGVYIAEERRCHSGLSVRLSPRIHIFLRRLVSRSSCWPHMTNTTKTNKIRRWFQRSLSCGCSFTVWTTRLQNETPDMFGAKVTCANKASVWRVLRARSVYLKPLVDAAADRRSEALGYKLPFPAFIQDLSTS